MSDDKRGHTHADTRGEHAGAKTRKRPSAISGRLAAKPETTQTPREPRPAKGEASVPHLPVVADLLRAVASSIERDPTLARSLLGDQPESGAATTDAGETETRSGPAGKTSRSSTTPGTKRLARSAQAPVPALDPFAILREHGESGLRTQLYALDAEGLHALVRTHRLDPARIASRWTNRERLIELIVEQVRARAGLGRAFERV